MKKIILVLVSVLLSQASWADFISVKRGIANESTSGNGSPGWMSEEELGGDQTNSGSMLTSVVQLLAEITKRNGSSPEAVSGARITIGTQRVNKKLVMTMGTDISGISASCARYDSNKQSCLPGHRLHGDSSSAAAQSDQRLTDALFRIVGEVDYHIANNSRSSARLGTSRRGEVNIKIEQVKVIPGIGNGYGVRYTVNVDGQKFTISCDSSYSGGKKLPGEEDAACVRN